MLTLRSSRNIGIVVFLGVAIALAARLTRGLDLYDESYYAEFIAEWLKGGFAQSPFRTLHQTSALIVYPAAWAFSALRGSTDGLFLFLRFLFLAGSVIAALLWYGFLRSLGNRGAAWLGAVIILSFIPFGLPAPSYNTTGMQAAMAAVACLGIAMASQADSTKQRAAEIGSAVAWAIAVAAYPPLGAVAATMVLTVFAFGERVFLVGKRYAALVVLCGCLGAATVVATISLTAVLESIHYLNLLNRVSSIDLKIQHTMALLRPYPWFVLVALAATCAGVFRNMLGALYHPLAVTLLLLALFAGPPALYIRSHDAITIAALSGLGLLTNLRLTAPRRHRILALCYLLSMLVAATTTATALHTVYNFCIGGLPAATIALIAPYASKRPQWPRQAAMAVLALTVLATSLTFRYGQTTADAAAPKQLIRHGIFQGLFAPTTLTELLYTVQQHVRPKIGDSTLAVFTELHPGIALELLAPLKMLTTFPLPAGISAEALAYNHAYYVNLANRPQFVLVFREGGAEPINPMQPDFDAWYVLDTEFKTSLGVMSLYRTR